MKSSVPITRSLGSASVFFGLAVALCLTTTHAGPAPTPLQGPTTETGAVDLTATFANGAVKINILRWSTDEERNRLVAAMDPTAPVDAPEEDAEQQGGRGNDEPPDPVVTAINEAPTVGYIWTDRVVGYSIKYAYHASLTDGSERIILATNRRLDGRITATGTPTKDEFTLIEIRLDSSGMGEGKTSLVIQAIIDDEAETVALDNYAGRPAIFQNVQR